MSVDPWHDAGTLQLRELIGLTRFPGRFPLVLYADGDRTSPVKRILRSCYGIYALFRFGFTNGLPVLLWGPGLSSLTGLVQVAHTSIMANVAGALFRGECFVFFRVSAGQGATAAQQLGMDEASGITVRLNRNESLVMEGASSGQACIIHYATSPHGVAAVRRHIRGLSAAWAALGDAAPAVPLPKVLRFREQGGPAMLVQQKIDGATGNTLAVSDAEFTRLVTVSLDLLDALYRSAPAQVASTASLLAGMDLSPLTTAVPECADALACAGMLLAEWGARGTVRCGPCHGDYWFANILFARDGDAPRIAAVIDWEWFDMTGPIGADAVHLLLVSYAARRGLRLPVLEARIFAGQPVDDLLAAEMERIGQRFGLAPDDLRCIVIWLWLRRAWRTYVVGVPIDRQWVIDNVVAPGKALLAAAGRVSGATV